MKPHFSYRHFFIFSLLLFAFLYIFLISVKSYTSESSYVVRDLSSSQVTGVDLGIFGLNTSGGNQDAYHVIEYLRSAETFTILDSKFNLKDRYQSSATDILERLWPWSKNEDFLDLYRKHLSITYDNLTNISHISFDCSDSTLATEVLNFLLNHGRFFLNRLNKERASTKLQIAQGMLQQNHDKMFDAVAHVEQFQMRHNLFDPSTDINTQSGIVARLESELVEKTAQLNQLQNYLNPKTFEVERLQKEISEIKSGLSKARARMTGPQQNRLNELVFEFQRLKSEADFAVKAYEQNVIQLEVSQLEIQKESKIFEIISAPTIPDGHSYPDRTKLTLTSIFLILAISKIAQLLWSVIQDHKD